MLLLQSPFEKMDLSQFGYVGLLVGAACFCWIAWLKYGNGRAKRTKLDDVHDACIKIETDVHNIRERVERIETKVFS